jgi:V8-like Glu-specific endopeptidase
LLLAGKRLDGTKREQFRNVLRPAFDIENLSRMLHDHLDKKIDDIIIPKGMSLPDVLDKVIDNAEQESWTLQLLQAALSVRSDDRLLNDFAQPFGIVIKTPPLKELVFERNINEQIPMYDLGLLVQRLYELAGQICRIEDAGKNHLGTGFLVKSDVIMTNYHVWKLAQEDRENFICYFDHGITSKPATYYLAKRGYKIDISKPNPKEGQLESQDVIPAFDELDYALLRLDKAAGEQLISHPHQSQPVERGWIKPYPYKYDFQPHTPLFILHYPAPESLSGTTLKISLETNAIIDWKDGNGTRIRYKTNTRNGSSGSPCFNANWDLVALHHGGDPNYKKSHRPEYNQGIPFFAILNLLKERKLRDIFSNTASPVECPTKEDEELENTQQASSHQASFSAQEQPHIIHLETGTPMPLPASQQLVEDEVSADDNRDKPGKIIDINTHKGQRETQKIDSHQSFLKEARRLFSYAQECVNEASRNLTHGAPSALLFRQAAQSLEAAHKAIQSLHELMLTGAEVPEAIRKNRTSIMDSFNTVTEQIEKHLLPSLNWKHKGNFAPLQQALQEIDKLLPEQNNR